MVSDTDIRRACGFIELKAAKMASEVMLTQMSAAHRANLMFYFFKMVCFQMYTFFQPEVGEKE